MKEMKLAVIILIALIALSGCTQQSLSFKGAAEPNVEIKGTVVSLYLDELTETDCGICPQDKALIRIDEIDRTNDPEKLVNLNVGDEINVSFSYSARPAKVIYHLISSVQPVSYELEEPEPPRLPLSEEEISLPESPPKQVIMENGYLVYDISDRTSRNVPQMILPGIEIGYKIKLRVGGQLGCKKDYSCKKDYPVVDVVEIAEYEIISSNDEKIILPGFDSTGFP